MTMELKLNLQYPYFEDLTLVNGGKLPLDKAAHACWYYYLLCENARTTVGKSTDDQRILSDQLWMSTEYPNQRRAIMILYGLKDMGDIDPYWPAVRDQAFALGMPLPRVEYMKNLRTRSNW